MTPLRGGEPTAGNWDDTGDDSMMGAPPHQRREEKGCPLFFFPGHLR